MAKQHTEQDEISREQMLERLMAKGVEDSNWAESALTPELLNAIVSGLVFAHRPITSAGLEIIRQHNLGPRGPFILSLIHNGVEHPKDLATLLRIGRSLVTSELQRLTNAGLIETTVGQDRRLLHLALTESGRQASAVVRATLARMIEQGLSAYSAEQVALFASMLQDIQRYA